MAPVRQCVPVDVERPRVRRSGPPFENVKPPRVIGTTDAHVIGDEIQNEAEPVLFQCRTQARKTFVTPKLRVKPIVIDNVVSVGTSGSRLEKRRRIQVRDAQYLEVRHKRGSVVKAKIPGELQAISRKRNLRSHQASPTAA